MQFKLRYRALLFALPLCIAVVAASAAVSAGGRGFDLSSLDKSCKPCADFYQFANGGWMANNPIPAAYPSWGRFDELAEKNRDTLHQILEERSKNIRAEYIKHVAKMFELLGDDQAKAASEADLVMATEKRLAEASMDNVQLRDPDAVYHKMDIAQLKTLAPNISWKGYFERV